MHETSIILVSTFSAMMLLITIGVMVSIIIKAARGSGRGKSSKENEEETRIIQEMYHGLMKMEQRVESLETLLLDDDRKRRAKFDSELNGE